MPANVPPRFLAAAMLLTVGCVCPGDDLAVRRVRTDCRNHMAFATDRADSVRVLTIIPAYAGSNYAECGFWLDSLTTKKP